MSADGTKKAVNVERRVWDKEKYADIAQTKSAAAAAEIALLTATTSSSSSSSQSEGGVDGEGVVLIDENAIRIARDKAAVKERVNKLALDGEQDEWFTPAPFSNGTNGPAASKRAFIKARTTKVDLTSKIGTSEIFTEQGMAANGVLGTRDGVSKAGIGWHCKVCDCYLKDTIAYLDHINGRNHQKSLGFTMRVEQSTTDDVMSALEGFKNKNEPTNNGVKRKGDEKEVSVRESMISEIKKRDEDEEASKAEIKEQRKRRKDERKAQAKTETKESKFGDENGGEDGGEEEDEYAQDEMDDEMKKIMGFSGFGGGR